MSNDFLTMFLVYLLTTFITLFFVSGVDLYFSAGNSISYLTIFKVNIFVALFTIVVLAGSLIITFNFLDFFDDTWTTIISLIISLAAIYFIKSYLLQRYNITLTSHFFVTLGGLLLFGGPIYIVYRMLKSFGKAFLH